VETRRICFLVEPQNQGRRFVSDLASKLLGWFTGTVCQWFSLKTTRTVFSGLASIPVVTVFSGLASKLVVMVFPGLASKLVGQVFWFGPQNRQVRFDDLDLKITATVS
jgi:hypothetical protein